MSQLWEALEERGANPDLVGHEGAEARGFGPMPRTIRAHPRWHRIPIVVVGDRKRGHFDEAMGSGADEYVSDKRTSSARSRGNGCRCTWTAKVGGNSRGDRSAHGYGKSARHGALFGSFVTTRLTPE